MDITLSDKGGFEFAAEIVPECEGRMPWEEHCGHGPVRELTGGYGSFHRTGKRPGERMLDETHAYDFAEACKIAQRDGWGFAPNPMTTAKNSGGKWHAFFGDGHTQGQNVGGFDTQLEAVQALYASHRATFPSARAYAAQAAERDFQRMRAFAQGDLEFVGVKVTAKRNGFELGNASLWGIESDSGEYFQEVAEELQEEALEEAQQALERLCQCEEA